jgi:DNA-binding response OmpR family regulator
MASETLEQLSRLTTGGALAHHVLLVEDDPDTAQATKALLEQHGFHVKIAKDGGQAHSSFAMHKPDFVILDLILPGESGFEVCEHMKQKDDSVPVLVVSAIALPDSRALAERVGADGYLVKPYEPPELLSTIEEIAQRVWERTHLDHPQEQARVRFSCACGKRFKVRPAHRGKTLTCSDCGAPIVVPRYD